MSDASVKEAQICAAKQKINKEERAREVRAAAQKELEDEKAGNHPAK